MADNKKFIEDNKDVLIQEMAEKIEAMNTIIGGVVEQPITEVDGSVMRTYLIAIGMQVGALTTLFNEYYVLLKGIVPKGDRPTGFASLIKSVDNHVPNFEPDEDNESADEE